jgi:predicted extracellular nuclease
MSYSVAFWNLENLFAPENHPDRPAWLAERVRKDLEGWSANLFVKKVGQLASGIASINGGAGPDLLGCCEVENEFALRAVATEMNGKLSSRDYEVVHVDSTKEQRGIDTAFIYDKKRLSPKLSEVFSHFVMRRTGTRDITQATFKADGRDLVALCNHWPSRSAGTGQGPEYSSGFRATAGETLAYWHDRIREKKGKDVAIIAFGDFNDDPFDKSLVQHALALREEGDVRRADNAKFYNLAWRYLTQAVIDHKGKNRVIDGTLYFGGNGNVFDQILVSSSLLTGESGLHVLPETACIDAAQPMVDHRVGEGPIRFGLPKGDAAKNITETGFSDHFPVSVKIEPV